MNVGPRAHRSASLRVAVAEGLPEEMRDDVMELLEVRSTNPRKGHATSLMWEVCTEADMGNKTLLINVRSFADGMTDEQLERFYGKFCFVRIQPEPLLMARSPQRLRIARVH